MELNSKNCAVRGRFLASLALAMICAVLAPSATRAQAAAPSTISTQDAERFLQQATFGYSDADVLLVQSIGYSKWIDNQFSMRVQYWHVAAFDKINPDFLSSDSNNVSPGMWIGFTKDDQLRERYIFAISQILVNTNYGNSTTRYGRSLARYVDILQTTGLTTFRDLLTEVTLNPSMGAFLSNLYNRAEDPVTGRQPNQNFAREVMQLFSIGLWQLNPDGSRKLDADGQPIPTYTQADVVGVSQALTGFAFQGASKDDWKEANCFCKRPADKTAQIKAMEGEDWYHSWSVKRFLGTKIKGGSTSPSADLKVVISRLAGHRNVGPFIGKQLIQRFVTSNPSPAYIARISKVFANDGAGVRGNMKAVIKAILLDREARDPAKVSDPTFGRIREPILRYAQLMRVFKAKPGADRNDFGIPNWDWDQHKGLWQSPLHSHTVFNFYSPDFKPAGTELFKRNLVSPEMQITMATSVGDIDNFMWWTLQNGGLKQCCGGPELTMKFDFSEWLPLVRTPSVLIEKMNQRFMSGQMSAALNSQIRDSMAEFANDQLKFARAMRVMLASAEYVVQK